MENNREALKKAVDSIKNQGVSKETNITWEEIARKIAISEKQLHAYLNGEDETPDGLAIKLKSAYNIKTFMIVFTDVKHVRDPSPNAPENRGNNRKSLKGIISLIKNYGKIKGMSITEEEVGRKIGISGEQLNAYLNGRDKIPGDLSSMLLSAYTDFLNTIQAENNGESLERTVVLIRNMGLAKGMNITAEEMAHEIGISGKQLYVYLRNGYDAAKGDISYLLRSSYKDLLKNVKEVELIEDINMIIASVRIG